MCIYIRKRANIKLKTKNAVCVHLFDTQDVEVHITLLNESLLVNSTSQSLISGVKPEREINREFFSHVHVPFLHPKISVMSLSTCKLGSGCLTGG